MTVAENIKKLRKEKGLTQKQLGELCTPKIAESTIRRYELGLLNPKFETLRKIAKVLDTTPSLLMEDVKNSVGENIKKYRTEQGLTQKDLADISGLKESDIKNYETGEIQPTFEILKNISQALGVYIGNFIEDWNDYPESKNYDAFSFATPYSAFYEGIKRKAEQEEKTLLEYYRSLNTEGRKEAQKRVQELTEIKKYVETEEPPLE